MEPQGTTPSQMFTGRSAHLKIPFAFGLCVDLPTYTTCVCLLSVEVTRRESLRSTHALASLNSRQRTDSNTDMTRDVSGPVQPCPQIEASLEDNTKSDGKRSFPTPAHRISNVFQRSRHYMSRESNAVYRHPQLSWPYPCRI